MSASAGTEPKQADSKGQRPRGRDSLRLRLASAAIGLPLLLALILADPPFTLALTAAAMLLGLRELYRLARVERLWLQRLPGFALGLALMAAAWQGQSGLLAALVVASPLALLMAHRGTPQALRPWLITIAGPLYLGATLAHGVLLRRLDRGAPLLIMAVLSTFAVDTAAYFVGRAVGRCKLAPRVSPGKTWEGAVGGFLAGIAAPIALAYLFGLPLAPGKAAAMGATLGIVGQAGDLMESALKRAHQAKDAGGLIPGHGGVLDRLDSVVYNLVVVYHFSVWGTV